MTVLIEGKTGSGKSMASIALAERIEEVLSKVTKRNIEFDVEKQVIYVPTEYSDKLDEWTKGKYASLVVDELRFLVPKAKWQSLLNQSIAETNAVIRSVKIKNSGYGGVIIYNTQDISDITKDVRKTINYDITMSRRSKRPHAYVYRFWLDKSNIEKPTLRVKKVDFSVGGIRFKIDKFIPVLPSTPVRKRYEEISVEAKSRILRRKRETILNELRKEMGNTSTIQTELENDQLFEMIKDLAIWKKGKVTFTPEKKKIIMKIFSISRKEFRNDFMPALIEVAKKRGLM